METFQVSVVEPTGGQLRSIYLYDGIGQDELKMIFETTFALSAPAVGFMDDNGVNYPFILLCKSPRMFDGMMLKLIVENSPLPATATAAATVSVSSSRDDSGENGDGADDIILTEENAEKAFNILDKNGDGLLHLSEVVEVLTTAYEKFFELNTRYSFAYSCLSSKEVAIATAQNFFTTVEAPSDGSETMLTYDDFCAWYLTAGSSPLCELMVLSLESASSTLLDMHMLSPKTLKRNKSRINLELRNLYVDVNVAALAERCQALLVLSSNNLAYLLDLISVSANGKANINHEMYMRIFYVYLVQHNRQLTQSDTDTLELLDTLFHMLSSESDADPTFEDVAAGKQRQLQASGTGKNAKGEPTVNIFELGSLLSIFSTGKYLQSLKAVFEMYPASSTGAFSAHNSSPTSTAAAAAVVSETILTTHLCQILRVIFYYNPSIVRSTGCYPEDLAFALATKLFLLIDSKRKAAGKLGLDEFIESFLHGLMIALSMLQIGEGYFYAYLEMLMTYIGSPDDEYNNSLDLEDGNDEEEEEEEEEEDIESYEQDSQDYRYPYDDNGNSSNPTTSNTYSNHSSNGAAVAGSARQDENSRSSNNYYDVHSSQTLLANTRANAGPIKTAVTTASNLEESEPDDEDDDDPDGGEEEGEGGRRTNNRSTVTDLEETQVKADTDLGVDYEGDRISVQDARDALGISSFPSSQIGDYLIQELADPDGTIERTVYRTGIMELISHHYSASTVLQRSIIDFIIDRVFASFDPDNTGFCFVQELCCGLLLFCGDDASTRSRTAWDVISACSFNQQQPPNGNDERASPVDYTMLVSSVAAVIRAQLCLDPTLEPFHYLNAVQERANLEVSAFYPQEEITTSSQSLLGNSGPNFVEMFSCILYMCESEAMDIEVSASPIVKPTPHQSQTKPRPKKKRLDTPIPSKAQIQQQFDDSSCNDDDDDEDEDDVKFLSVRTFSEDGEREDQEEENVLLNDSLFPPSAVVLELRAARTILGLESCSADDMMEKLGEYSPGGQISESNWIRWLSYTTHAAGTSEHDLDIAIRLGNRLFAAFSAVAHPEESPMKVKNSNKSRTQLQNGNNNSNDDDNAEEEEEEGVVPYERMAAGLAFLCGASPLEERLMVAFTVMDADSDGCIVPEELQAIIHSTLVVLTVCSRMAADKVILLGAPLPELAEAAAVEALNALSLDITAVYITLEMVCDMADDFLKLAALF